MQLQVPYRDLFSRSSIRLSLDQDPLNHPCVHSFDCSCRQSCSICGPGHLGVIRTEKSDPAVLTSYRDEESPDSPLDKNTKVCIIGAGIAGLYLALILQDLEIPNLSWDILEANRDRIGGRIYTHRFSEAHNDYYDVGAMRFPQIPIMSRVFDLFHRMQVPLKEFHMRDRSTNTKGYDISKTEEDSPPANLLSQSFGPFKKAMQKDFVHGFQLLMQADAMSTREYLRGSHKTDFRTIQSAESNTTGTGMFDQAFSESVMDFFDLDQPMTGPRDSGGDIKWYSIDGGSSVVIERMSDQINRNSTIELGKQVRRIAINGGTDLSVSCAGEEKARDGYATVFSTTPLACLQRIDTKSLHLDPIQEEAIRCLRYEDSTKVGIKFAYPWWIVDCGLRGGGSASSTLPSRTCVYPSHIPEAAWNQPAVLLASYTWGQDATRMGALISSPSSGGSELGEDELLDLVLRDLVQQHRQYGITYEKLQDLYLDHHAFCWGNSRFSSGAFALFAPGQFTNLYPSLSLPAADGKFHIVGEASSVHHGWVVGSLNSAYAAVYRFLLRYGQRRAIQKLEKNWGTVHELDLAGVAELDRSS